MKKPITRISSNKISVRNTSGRALPLKVSCVKELVVKIFKCLRRPLILTNILFLSDRQILSLNKKYLKASHYTDVIAFNHSDDELCDIAISLDTARRNALTYKTTYKNEVILYVIHGILHICGYEDKTPARRKIMFKKQEEILRRVKCAV